MIMDVKNYWDISRGILIIFALISSLLSVFWSIWFFSRLLNPTFYPDKVILLDIFYPFSIFVVAFLWVTSLTFYFKKKVGWYFAVIYFVGVIIGIINYYLSNIQSIHYSGGLPYVTYPFDPIIFIIFAAIFGIILKSRSFFGIKLSNIFAEK
jgi:hypothetical protein